MGIRLGGNPENCHRTEIDLEDTGAALRQLQERVAELEGQLRGARATARDNAGGVAEANARVAELEGALRGVAGDLAEARLHHEQGKFSDEGHRDGLERTEWKARSALNQHQGERDA